MKLKKSTDKKIIAQEQKIRFAKKLLKKLREIFPGANCSLNFRSPFELLVATILSAQCTDVQVNKVTTTLFQKYNKPEHFASIPAATLEKLIKSTGFYKNKTKNIKAAATEIINRFDGNIPQTISELVTLPGVGRKTANVVLSNGFGVNEGFVVDTHVFRLSHRLGLADGKIPEKVEQELMVIFPQLDWSFLSHALIQLGRKYCKSRKPACQTCPINYICPQSNKIAEQN
ncbi:MAG: endonuclease III [Planctomycetaceae bacterium]|nr:endonuclease III [Planctomycetaceae bacterium]